ncbi:pantoate kinase [Vulcanisaeta distributa]|nr:pantoate kinase [Vulcanisaeta distributa]
MIIIDVPLHITSIWLPIYGNDPVNTGSLGCGIVIRPGVRFMFKPTASPTRYGIDHVDLALRELGVNAEVNYSSPVQLGVGYGMSAALALGTALGAAVIARKPLIKAAQVAHVIEVRLGTGLGDVIAEYYGGGIELRLRAGAPGIGIIDRIPYPRDLAIVTADLGRYSTSDMLRELRDKLATLGSKYVNELISEPTYEKFTELSTAFSREVGFLTRDLEDRVKPCARYADAYYVKKRVLVFLTRRDEVEALINCLRTVGYEVRVFEPSNEGVRVMINKDVFK